MVDWLVDLSVHLFRGLPVKLVQTTLDIDLQAHTSDKKNPQAMKDQTRSDSQGECANYTNRHDGKTSCLFVVLPSLPPKKN